MWGLVPIGLSSDLNNIEGIEPLGIIGVESAGEPVNTLTTEQEGVAVEFDVSDLPMPAGFDALDGIAGLEGLLLVVVDWREWRMELGCVELGVFVVGLLDNGGDGVMGIGGVGELGTDGDLPVELVYVGQVVDFQDAHGFPFCLSSGCQGDSENFLKITTGVGQIIVEQGLSEGFTDGLIISIGAIQIPQSFEDVLELSLDFAVQWVSFLSFKRVSCLGRWPLRRPQ